MRSNAIVIAAAGATIGIGAGQMSRVDAVRIAIEKARAAQPELLAGAGAGLGCVLPVRRRPPARDRRGRHGDHPAGRSVRDEEVVAAVDAAGVAMVATGVRHFRH